jgi:hypothetical protein
VSYLPNPGLDSMVPAGLKARMRAAADSMVAGTLIAAPRPASMDASRSGDRDRSLAAVGAGPTSRP